MIFIEPLVVKMANLITVRYALMPKREKDITLIKKKLVQEF